MYNARTININSGVLRVNTQVLASQFTGNIYINSGSSFIFKGLHSYIGNVTGNIIFEDGTFTVQNTKISGFTANSGSSVVLNKNISIDTVTLNSFARMEIKRLSIENIVVNIKNLYAYVSFLFFFVIIFRKRKIL